MFRFYFLLSLPKQRTKGILLIQKIGALGVVTPLKIALQEALAAKCPNYNVHIRQLSTQGVFDRFMDKGDLRKIRFIRFKVPKAIEDAYADGHGEIHGRTELVIKISRGNGMPFGKAIRKFQKGKGNLGDIIELGDEHFDADTIKMELSVGGKRRTLMSMTQGICEHNSISPIRLPLERTAIQISTASTGSPRNGSRN